MASDTITYPLKRQRDAVWNKFLDYFENKRNCDVVFRIKKDNIEIHAHKIILECASEYFTSLFNSESSNEDNSNEYEISTVEGSIFLSIVHSIYYNEITVNKNNCVRLLEASYVMKLEEIQEICTKFMIENVTTQNCLEYLKISEINSNSSLAEASVKSIFRNFALVVESEEFLTLPRNALELLLTSSGSICPDEEEIFEAFQKWIKFDLKNRKRFIEPLIVDIKLPLIKKDYFWKTVEPWIRQHTEDKTITSNVGKWHAIQEIDSKFKPMTLERNPQYLSSDANFRHVFVYTADGADEIVICRVSMVEKSYSSISINKVFYYFGQSVKIVEEFDEDIFREPGEKNEFKSDAKLCYYKDDIYAFRNEGRILEIKKYNIRENKFSTLPNLNDFAGTIYGAFACYGDIYLVVIIDSTNVLQRYDFCEQSLETVGKMQRISGECTLVVSTAGIYAFAKDGTSESFDLSSNNVNFAMLNSESSDEEWSESTDEETSQSESQSSDEEISKQKSTDDKSPQHKSIDKELTNLNGSTSWSASSQKLSQSESSAEHIYEVIEE